MKIYRVPDKRFNKEKFEANMRKKGVTNSAYLKAAGEATHYGKYNTAVVHYRTGEVSTYDLNDDYELNQFNKLRVGKDDFNWRKVSKVERRHK